MTDEHTRERGHDTPDQAEAPIEAGMRRLLRTQLDRRRFLIATGSSMGMAMLAGAGSVRAQSPAATQVALGDTLNLATWPNYHSQETLDAFQAQTGVAVNLTVYGSTEEMEAKLRAGNSGIDLVVPSNYAIQGWTADRLIEPLDYSKLPGVDLSAWNPLFVDQDFDPDNTYTIPKNWGTTGIAYRTDKMDSAAHELEGVLPDGQRVGEWQDRRGRPPDLRAGLRRCLHGLQLQHHRSHRAGGGRGDARRPQAPALRHHQ